MRYPHSLAAAVAVLLMAPVAQAQTPELHTLRLNQLMTSRQVTALAAERDRTFAWMTALCEQIPAARERGGDSLSRALGEAQYATLGLNLLLLRLFWDSGPRLATWGSPLLVFGRTALFFYLVHLYLYAVAGRIVGLWQPAGAGFPLMYAVGALGLLALYPLCRAYGRFKQTKAPDSLWRLL